MEKIQGGKSDKGFTFPLNGIQVQTQAEPKDFRFEATKESRFIPQQSLCSNPSGIQGIQIQINRGIKDINPKWSPGSNAKR